jgi:hypothetical protein
MKLYKDGIVRNTEVPSIIADLKKAGYVEMIEAIPEAPQHAAGEVVENAAPAPQPAAPEKKTKKAGA